MRESTALGSALLAGAALGLFGWDLTKPETLAEVNTANVDIFEPEITEKKRLKMIRGWNRAVDRAKAWHTAESEDEDEETFEEEEGVKSVA
jgi:glycerol kinase